MGTVTAIHRYPVKSMLGEDLASAVVTPAGLSGDRVCAVLDETGAVGSAKHPRRWGKLLGCRSRMTEDGSVLVDLPDADALAVGDPELDARLTALLGRPVVVSATAPEEGTLERAVPDYEGGVPEAVRATARVDETGEAITVTRMPSGTFFDYGLVHLLTTSSLRTLRAAHPAGDVDQRRFRPNLVVDTGVERGFVEDRWVGAELRVGEVLFRVVVPTPRCVVPNLGHGDLPADPDLMRTVAREHRIPVLDVGRLACVGVYLEILEPGVVSLGDPVSRSQASSKYVEA